MSCGCAVISIPHAVEALEHHAGILLKEFNNRSLNRQFCGSLKKGELRWEKCFSLSHGPIWENIAIKYGLMFGELTNREKI
jgi:hypothetical protein